jgi:hypothetical protein
MGPDAVLGEMVAGFEASAFGSFKLKVRTHGE